MSDVQTIEESREKVITIPYRDAEGWMHGTVSIKVDWACPVCGQPMGEPVMRNYCEDGEFYGVHNWESPCGHHINYGQLNPPEVLPPFYQKGRKKTA